MSFLFIPITFNNISEALIIIQLSVFKKTKSFRNRSYIVMWFKTGLKILNYTQNNESLSKRSDFTVLSYNLLFYLTNSPARNKQNKPQKAVCARVCIYLYVWFCWRAFVCLCVAERVESGYCQAVYLIEKPALWSRAAGSISQRYASFLQFCIFLQTLRYTYVYLHQASMHSHSVYWFTYHPHEQTPI